MELIVCKFGGSSLADAAGFLRARRILERSSGRKYVVVSAPGKRSDSDEKITDLLARANIQSAHGGSEALAQVCARYRAIGQALGIDGTEAWLTALCRDVRRAPMLAASRGEWLCAKMFAAFTGLPFVDAETLIRFDAGGDLLQGETRRRIRAMAARTAGAVVPGFYGGSADGAIHTFPRGGSDISGALIAAALGAKRYENWTDVDGLMSADPRLCAGAVCHNAVSYRQMRRLARAGARVLHPDCLSPAADAGVPTVLRNTFAPERGGTYISDCVRGEAPCVCAREDLCAVPIEALSADARGLIAGRADFIASDGGKLAAMPRMKNRRAAALVSAFGLPRAQLAAACEDVQPLGVRTDDGCAQFLIPAERMSGAANALHARLLRCAGIAAQD